MTLGDFLSLDVLLNALAFVFTAAGLALIRREHKLAHTFCMAVALLASCIFLGGRGLRFVTGETVDALPASASVVSSLIIRTHLPLSFVAVGLATMSVIRALQARYESHRRWSQWTLPVWLYVSFTGTLLRCLTRL